MEKFIQQYSGIIVFLLAYAIAGVVALVKMSQRLSLLEVEMKDIKKDLEDAVKVVNELKRDVADIRTELRTAMAETKADVTIVRDRLTSIVGMADDIKHTFEKAFEMRPRT